MKFRALIQSGLILVLVLSVSVLPNIVFAETGLSLNSEPGKFVKITKATATIETDGLHIEGSLQRRLISPRGPIKGIVMVAIHDAEGELIQEKTLQTSSLFVPKGIRKAHFSGVLTGTIPSNATVTISSVN